MRAFREVCTLIGADPGTFASLVRELFTPRFAA